MFYAIIRNIVGTRSPKETEVALSFAAVEPVVFHVRGFGLTLDNGVVINTNLG